MTIRLSPKKAFALRLAFGALVLITAAWLFGSIAEDVVNRDAPLGTIDLAVSAWLHAHATPARTSAMIFISQLGAPLTASAIAVVVALFLLWRRQRYRLLALVLAVPGGSLVNVVVKQVIHRHRPVFSDPIQTLTSYSFPSGHALGATVLYGMIAAMLVWRVDDWRLRALAASAAFALIVLISFSRIYLGLHYLSDVIAGFLEGVVWLGVCLAAVTALRNRRTRANERTSA
ncbi:MAG: phosphatase PAP2 family protein [Dokdonella sp.]